ncbi:MAG TPA: DUF4388 domain-containing protein [Dictyobacter sp.]|nr:DUF4388 domain-containing protein [Dictyobacter sp.]
MSLIGTIEQFGLSNVLERLERHEKTGLLMVKQASAWVEFYFNDGRLLCIGPLRTSLTLGERLVQDGVISAAVLNEARLALQANEQSEVYTARMLMESGHVSREGLRSWAINKTVDVLRAVLFWTTGEMYFDEGTLPPDERLLVSMSVHELLEIATPPPLTPQEPQGGTEYDQLQTRIAPALPQNQTQYPNGNPNAAPVTPRTPSPDVARVPTLMNASQFIDDSSFSVLPSVSDALPVTSTNNDAFPNTESLGSLFAAEGEFETEQGFVSLFGEADDVGQDMAGPRPLQPEPVMQPIPPKRIDISFMQPEMVLLPADLSAFRDQNPRVQITPDQWQVLARVDGRTSLMAICQELAVAPEIICVVAGELIAEGLVHIAMPTQDQVQELSPISRELAASGMSNGYVVPGYASTAASPWSASLPPVVSPEQLAQQSPSLPFETESQWGNGGNGATFVPGRGWITTPQPLQPLESNGPFGPQNGPSYPSLGTNY